MRALLAMLAVLLLTPAAVAEVTVAVLDSGVDAEHPQLSGRVERMAFVSPLPTLPVVGGIDLGGAQDDPSGRGTGVASLVAGSTLGVDPQARILDLAVTYPLTGTMLDPASEQAAIDAMDWLLTHHGGPDAPGARVAVLSFADQAVSDVGASTLAAQARQLWEDGVLVVVPGSGGEGPLHASPYVLTVTGAEECGTATPVKPDLGAPSAGLTVATPGNAAVPGGTGTDSGTRLAAAQVAGTAALMWDARPGLPVHALTALLRASAAAGCTPFGDLATDAAVQAAEAWEDPLSDAGGKDGPLAGPVALGAVAVALALRRRRA